MRKILILLTILLACCLVLAIGGFIAFYNTNVFATARPTAHVVELGTPTPFVVTTAAPGANDTLDRLVNDELPVNDSNSIAQRLKGIAPVSFATPSAPQTLNLGDQTTFWVSRDITGTYQLVTATLGYSTTHSYIWVEQGINASANDLKTNGDAFENRIYPADRQYLGSELTPGIDNDPHIFILFTHFRNAAGYITSSDEYPRTVRAYSNLHEMIYLNTDAVRPGTASFNEVIAHEFAHLIHTNQNHQESAWLKEGLGDLTIRLAVSNTQPLEDFTRHPNLQLTGWTNETADVFAYYEASYLFLSYGLDRFGNNFLRGIVSSGTRDTNSIQYALNKDANGLSFDDFFADWVVTNAVNNPLVANGKYSYKQDRPNITTDPVIKVPETDNGPVHQYGTNYYDLPDKQGQVTITFHGDTSVPVIPTIAHSGKNFWWGNNADLSDTSLTRAIDLTSVKNATLNFRTWYDIESNFDYGYVEASSDNGKTWQTLKGKYTTNSDPNGANFGNGLTGKSGAAIGDNAATPTWVQEQMDLSAFAGQKILVRFEYITDDEYVGAGLALDDISIPEIGWSDDAESDESAWQTHGFVRMDNVVPQRFLVQVIEFGDNFKVERIALDPSNSGTLTVGGIGSTVKRVIVAVSGITPVTWQSGNYQLVVSP